MKVVTVVLKVILGIFAAALCVLASYAAWRVIRAHWAAILLFSYLAVGAAMVLVALIAAVRKKGVTPVDVYGVVRRVAAGREWLGPARAVMEQGLSFVVGLTGWPYPLIHGMRHAQYAAAGQLQAAASLSLEGVDVGAATTGLALVVATYAATYLGGGPSVFARAFLVVMVDHTISRHLVCAVGLTKLPVRVRQTLGSPYASFLVILACDFGTLVLGFNGIINWNRGAFASLPDLWAIASGLFTDMFTTAGVKAFLHGQQPRLIDVVVGAAGLLYYTTIVGAALHFQEFKRTDEDYQSLAHKRCLLGEFNDALKLMDKTAARTRPGEIIRAIAYVGVNQFERASNCLTAILHNNGHAPTPDAIFTALTNAATSVSMPSGVFVAFIKHGLRVPVSDERVAFAIQQLPDDAAINQDLLSTLDDAEVSKRAPLARALVLSNLGRLDESRTILDGLTARGVLDEVMRDCLLLTVGIRNPNTTRAQDAAYFEQWTDQYFTSMTRALASVTAADEKTFLLSQLVPVAAFAQMLKSPRTQAWFFVLEDVRRDLRRDPANKDEVEIMERLEALLRDRIP